MPKARKMHFRTPAVPQGDPYYKVACGWKQFPWKDTTGWLSQVTCKKCLNSDIYKKMEAEGKKFAG